MRKLLDKNKGITLVALVITIIILIILAGITISLILGEDGLIEKAKSGGNNYKNSAVEEQKILNSLNTQMDGLITGVVTNPEVNNESNNMTKRDVGEYHLLAEITTTDISNYEARINIKDNISNSDYDIWYNDHQNNAENFSGFDIVYDYPNWKVTSSGKGTLFYSLDAPDVVSEYTEFSNLEWGYGEYIHYYLYIYLDENEYICKMDFDEGTGEKVVKYSVNTETFTLPIPTKQGFEFTGWTGSNGDTPQINVTIAKGSYGDRSYKANWRKTYNVIAEITTYSTDGYEASVKVKDYINNTEDIYVYNTVNNEEGHDFGKFRLNYQWIWKIQKNGENNLKYNTTDYWKTYSDLSYIEWGYDEVVHYYIAEF